MSTEARWRRWRWVVVLAILGSAGVAFVYKLAEFMFTLGSAEAEGFADLPITVYFIVAAGWLCILVWCFLTGKFSQLEQAKYEMLAQEEEYERLGQ